MIDQAAKESEYDRNYIRYLARKQFIKGEKHGGTWLIDLESLKEYEQRMNEEGTKKLESHKESEVKQHVLLFALILVLTSFAVFRYAYMQAMLQAGLRPTCSVALPAGNLDERQRAKAVSILQPTPSSGEFNLPLEGVLFWTDSHSLFNCNLFLVLATRSPIIASTEEVSKWITRN